MNIIDKKLNHLQYLYQKGEIVKRELDAKLLMVTATIHNLEAEQTVNKKKFNRGVFKLAGDYFLLIACLFLFKTIASIELNHMLDAGLRIILGLGIITSGVLTTKHIRANIKTDDKIIQLNANLVKERENLIKLSNKAKNARIKQQYFNSVIQGFTEEKEKLMSEYQPSWEEVQQFYQNLSPSKEQFFAHHQLTAEELQKLEQIQSQQKDVMEEQKQYQKKIEKYWITLNMQ